MRLIFLCSLAVGLTVIKSAAQFTRVTSGPPVNDGVSTYGAAWIDFDADGDEDLFVVSDYGDKMTDFLYQNNGDGTFKQVLDNPLVIESGWGRSSTWGDYNNDGFPDAYVINQLTASLFRNEQGSSFQKIEGLPSTGFSFDSDHMGTSWGDYDNDGDLDLFVSNYATSDASRSQLYENVNNVFVKTANTLVEARSSASEPSWIDYDNNGTLDLFVANYMLDPLFVYKNNGDKTFTRVTAGMPLQVNSPSVGMSWADYDNDGDFDVMFSVNVNGPNAFYENNGDGTFTLGHNAIATVKSSAASWADIDNDGNIDLICVGGDGDETHLFRNRGDKTFADVTVQYGFDNQSYSWAVVTADYDHDGALDVFITGAEGNNRNVNDILYRNNGNGNHWLAVRVAGKHSNRSAIGSTVTTYVQGKRQLRAIQSKTGGGSQNSLTAHFGLGTATVVDSVVVAWPGKGFQYLTAVTSDQILDIQEITLPARPTEISGRNSGADQVTLTWTDNSSNEVGYRVERSEGDDKHFEVVGFAQPNTTSFLDEAATVNKKYFYRVFAIVKGGLSLASEQVAVESIVTGIESTQQFSIYPNPVTRNVSIAGQLRDKQTFIISTTLGQVVKKFELNGSDNIVSLDELPAGVYILSGANQSVRLVKTE